MYSLNDIIKIIKDNKTKIKTFGVERVGIFGSYLRGEARPESDIDLIIEFNDKNISYKNYMALYDFLESLYSQKIDLLTPEQISPYMMPYISKEAHYERL